VTVFSLDHNSEIILKEYWKGSDVRIVFARENEKRRTASDRHRVPLSSVPRLDLCKIPLLTRHHVLHRDDRTRLHPRDRVAVRLRLVGNVGRAANLEEVGEAGREERGDFDESFEGVGVKAGEGLRGLVFDTSSAAGADSKH
jgi:hypothetical protein